MSRSEHDAHRDMSKPLTFWDGRRFERAEMKREFSRRQREAAWLWVALATFAFTAGALLGKLS